MVRNAGLSGLTLLALACASSFEACGGLSVERVDREPGESGGSATVGNGGTGVGVGSGGATGASTAASAGGTRGSSTEEFGGVGAEPEVACEKHRAGSVCIVGTETATFDEAVHPGDAFYVGVTPVGCYSDTCTVWAQDVCRLDASNGDYFASVGFCSYSVPPRIPPCDETCWDEITYCTSSVRLTAGHHVLWYGTQHVDFDVPSVFSHRSLCTE